jgi:hypothetical protein
MLDIIVMEMRMLIAAIMLLLVLFFIIHPLLRLLYTRIVEGVVDNTFEVKL